MRNMINIPVHTASALLMACVDVADIIESESVTPEILDELKFLQPFLEDFMAQTDNADMAV